MSYMVPVSGVQAFRDGGIRQRGEHGFGPEAASLKEAIVRLGEIKQVIWVPTRVERLEREAEVAREEENSPAVSEPVSA